VDFHADLRALLLAPRGTQAEHVQLLQKRAAKRSHPEEWNTQFGPKSLFQAWTSSPLMQALYGKNTAVIRPLLDRTTNWRVVELGGGDGRIWELLRPDDRGEILLIDPQPEVHAQVASRMPSGVNLQSVVDVAQAQADWGQADLVLSSLTLHHVAGLDAEQREEMGLRGPGKLEVLRRAKAALADRQGLLLLNEASVHCEIDLAPNGPELIDNLIDSYLRRCAKAMLDSIEQEPEHPMSAQWLSIAHRWCLDQITVGTLPLAERDVYELDVLRWLDLLPRAGFQVEGHQFSDPYRLFCQYLCR
jgi:hypothetical protein